MSTINTTTRGYNAHVSQLAVDCSYYQTKANECWEMLARLDDQPTEVHEEVHITTSFHDSGYDFPVKIFDIAVINQIMMALCTSYRAHYAKSKQALDQLRSLPADNCDDMPM